MQLDPTRPWKKLLGRHRVGQANWSRVRAGQGVVTGLHVFMMTSGAVQFGGLLPKTAIKKPGRGLEPQGHGSCFPKASIHRGSGRRAPFFSPGHAVTEPLLDKERFSKRDPLMAHGQRGWELSSGPVPHVSASYVRTRMEGDADSHTIAVTSGRLSLHHTGARKPSVGLSPC